MSRVRELDLAALAEGEAREAEARLAQAGDGERLLPQSFVAVGINVSFSVAELRVVEPGDPD